VTVAVVANPSAGRGRGGRLLPKVEAVLRSLDVPYRVHVSRDGADAERLARGAAEGGAAVVAALGGDGQLGACANGVLGTEAALAAIPAGSGNDFAKHLGIDPRDPLAAVRLLRDPTTRRVDVVRATTPERERHYVNVGGVGFDSEVNLLANRTRFLSGTAKYVFAVFVTLARFRPGAFTLRVDGEEHAFRAMLVAVANGSAYGGGMRVCPEAREDDGLLDVCVVTEIGKGEFVRTFPKVFRGRHVEHPAVRMLRARRVEVRVDRPFQVFADGEHVGGVPATFAVVPRALPVVVPPASSR
jgi:diacylglycerol kinase (ATP)